MHLSPAAKAGPGQSDKIIRAIAAPAVVSFEGRAAFEFRLIVTGTGCQGITL
jgi:hypothetical protein